MQTEFRMNSKLLKREEHFIQFICLIYALDSFMEHLMKRFHEKKWLHLEY